jgi:hypothetical protein
VRLGPGLSAEKTFVQATLCGAAAIQAIRRDRQRPSPCEKSVDMLRSVMTKPLGTFASAKLSPNDLEQFAAFLQAVARQIAEKQRAA